MAYETDVSAIGGERSQVTRSPCVWPASGELHHPVRTLFRCDAACDLRQTQVAPHEAREAYLEEYIRGFAVAAEGSAFGHIPLRGYAASHRVTIVFDRFGAWLTSLPELASTLALDFHPSEAS